MWDQKTVIPMLMACSYCWPTKKGNSLNGFYTGVNTVHISE